MKEKRKKKKPQKLTDSDSDFYSGISGTDHLPVWSQINSIIHKLKTICLIASC